MSKPSKKSPPPPQPPPAPSRGKAPLVIGIVAILALAVGAFFVVQSNSQPAASTPAAAAQPAAPSPAPSAPPWSRSGPGRPRSRTRTRRRRNRRGTRIWNEESFLIHNSTVDRRAAAFARLFEAVHEGVYIGTILPETTSTIAANPHLKL